MWHIANRFDRSLVEPFLDSGPERAILLGLPGAGKTYSLRRAAARLADQLHQVCLQEPFEESATVIPIFADLKLYRGNLGDLVSQTLPNSLPLAELIKNFKVRILLDSFNEMSREFWETGSWETDFENFTRDLKSASLIVGSRTLDGLTKLEYPAYTS